MGMDYVWIYDYLMWCLLYNKFWFGVLLILIVVVCVILLFWFGMFVVLFNFCEFVFFVKEFMMFDDISVGCLILGIGVGVDGYDVLVIRNDVWFFVER